MDYTAILGFSAAFLTTLAFVPQAVKTLRSRHTKDISFGMYTLFTLGITLWLLYGLVIQDWPIILANVVTLCLATTILVLKIKHG